MPSWLEVVLLVGITSLFWLALIAGILITCCRRIYVARVRENLANKRAEDMQKLMDSYGIKEITIGDDE